MDIFIGSVSLVIVLAGIYLKIGRPKSKLHLVLFSIGTAGFIMEVILSTLLMIGWID